MAPALLGVRALFERFSKRNEAFSDFVSRRPLPKKAAQRFRCGLHRIGVPLQVRDLEGDRRARTSLQKIRMPFHCRMRREAGVLSSLAGGNREPWCTFSESSRKRTFRALFMAAEPRLAR